MGPPANELLPTKRTCVFRVPRGPIGTARWDQIANELLEISAARLAARPQAKEMGFLDGRFDPAVVGRKRIFLCRSTDRIEGFVICNPCLNGAEWALDVFRQRPDAPRGTVAFLIHQTLEFLKQEQIGRASLCLVPALGAKTAYRAIAASFAGGST